MLEHLGPRLGISCYRGSEGVAIVMSQCHAILTVHVLTKAGELVLDPMAGKGESGVSHSTPSHNSRIFKYIDIIYIYISMFLMAMRASTGGHLHVCLNLSQKTSRRNLKFRYVA